MVMDVRQSRNFDCAVRRDWNEFERWVSSASSWVFSSCRRGTGRDVISTGKEAVSTGQIRRFGGETDFGLAGRLGLGLVLTPSRVYVVLGDGCREGGQRLDGNMFWRAGQIEARVWGGT